MSAENVGQSDGTHVLPHRQIVALESDLFFAVKIKDTLKHAGYETRIVRTAESMRDALVSGDYCVALVNLAARGVDWQAGIHAAQDAGIPAIAYGPHVDLEAQSAAREAGATRVIANSRLVDLPAMIERVLARASSSQAASGASDEEGSLKDEAPADDVVNELSNGETVRGTSDSPDARREA